MVQCAMEGKVTSECGSATGEPVCKRQKISPDKVKLSIGDSVIVADKQRLIDSSPYFASLLRFHAADNLETVVLDPPVNTDLDCFLAVLNNLANPNVKLNITATNLQVCIALSAYFQGEHIQEECVKAVREMLPTLTMDELLRVWRSGHAGAFEKITKLALVGISLKMDSASQSQEFLNLSTDELVALMRDDGFLPLLEYYVCKAVKAWCEHDPENRKTEEVLQQVLAEVAWDDSTSSLIQSIYPEYQKPDKMLKRAVNSDGFKIPDKTLLKDVRASNGIIVGNFLYCLENAPGEDEVPSFRRIDMNSRERKYLGWLHPEADLPNFGDFRSSLCLVKLAGRDKIACFVSYQQSLRREDDGMEISNVVNTIELYDIMSDKWQGLPCLPLPRIGCAMIQCGSFLYVIGGEEHQALRVNREICRRCYRLDLDKFLKYREEWGEQGYDKLKEVNDNWERIADLIGPTDGRPCAKIQHGRIVVSGCRSPGCGTRFLEAYDPMLNCWTFFDP